MLIGWPLGLVHSYRVLTSNCNGFVSPIDPGIGIAIKWKRSKLNFAEESTFSSRCWCRSGLTAADIGFTNVPFPHSIIHIQLLKRIPGWPCALIRMYKLLPHGRGRPPPKKKQKQKNSTYSKRWDLLCQPICSQHNPTKPEFEWDGCFRLVKMGND